MCVCVQSSRFDKFPFNRRPPDITTCGAFKTITHKCLCPPSGAGNRIRVNTADELKITALFKRLIIQISRFALYPKRFCPAQMRNGSGKRLNASFCIGSGGGGGGRFSGRKLCVYEKPIGNCFGCDRRPDNASCRSTLRPALKGLRLFSFQTFHGRYSLLFVPDNV